MPLHYLQDLWDDALAAGMDEPDLLTYRSNLLGSDLRLTNFGGGNTSAKVREIDPVTGDEVEVLWVKGSGGDLGSIKRDGFATLYMDRLLALKRQYQGVHEEDAMADRYVHCTFNANPRAASIDTPLHGFLPFKHVDHLHPDWAIALAACANGPAQLERLRAETGLHLVWLPWKRPGFELGLWLEKAVQHHPDADGIILGSHGLFTWGNDAKSSYQNTLRVIDAIGAYVVPRINAQGDALFGGQVAPIREDARALALSVLPAIRGMVGHGIGHWVASDDVMRFVNSADADRLAWQGTSCPDHFVRTKVRPLLVKWDAATGDAGSLIVAAKEGMEDYRRDYADYYQAHKSADSPAMRNPNPTVVLIPGVGMLSFGKNKTEARITGEFYVNAIHVMEGATSLGDLPPQEGLPAHRVVNNYVALDPAEAFGIEYWSLEEAKLRRMPPEKELSRKIALVLGAGPGIGRCVAERLAAHGAHVVVADRNATLAEELAAHLQAKFGKELATGLTADATDPVSLALLMEGVIASFGGLDILIDIVGIFIPPGEDGKNTVEQWRTTFDVNVTSMYLASEAAHRVFVAQGTPAAIVHTTSVNAVVPKKGSLAYDTSKTALNHLVRELAMEYAPLVRVNAVAPATVVAGSQMFPRDRVISSLTKYAIPFDPSDSDETLRDRLSAFYAQRTMLKRAVTPERVADALVALATDRFELTTGQVVNVDAGLHEAFLR